ncbi:sugar ABC transporter ATPase [Staphylococcus gallinarum]|nr:sugar ABC transporter ATPase [Staphylococcus gallinarum]
MALLMFNDIGKLNINQNIDQSTIQNQHKNPYEEKLAYGIVLADSVKLDSMQNTAAKTVAKYGFVTITGENTKYYRVVVDNKNYRIAKNKLRYFDPAGLFESHSF